MEKGLVSVVLPTYNRAKVLPRAIESVLNQTYTNIELIIVDDGSRDNTKEIIREFQSQDERIVYLRNKRNLGANAARNIGIMHSTGEFIAFMDSDDMWLPWKLERQIKIMYSSLNSYPIVYSGFIRIYKTDKNKVILSYYPQKSPPVSADSTSIHLNLLTNANFISTPTVLIPALYIRQNKLLFDEKMPRLQDWEFFLRLSKHCNCNFRFIPEPLVIAYVQPDSISMNHKKFIKALKILYTKYYSKVNNQEALSTFYFLMGYAMFLLGNIDESQHYLAVSLELKKEKHPNTLFVGIS